MSQFRTLDQADVKNKRVLVRVDLNVPMDNGTVTDATRIERIAPTITEIADKGGKVILLAHFGRPKGRDPKDSLKPVAAHLKSIAGFAVQFLGETDTDVAVAATKSLKDGEVLLLENTRFLPGEEKNDDALSQRFAKLGDVYVNDAFGAAHRAHASTAGVAKYLKPAVAGLLMARELEYLGGALSNPKRPFVAILGGSKISGKIDVIEHLLPKVNLFGYGQVESPYGSGEFYDYIHEMLNDKPNVVASRIPDRDAILGSIREFLGTGR